MRLLPALLKPREAFNLPSDSGWYVQKGLSCLRLVKRHRLTRPTVGAGATTAHLLAVSDAAVERLFAIHLLSSKRRVVIPIHHNSELLGKGMKGLLLHLRDVAAAVSERPSDIDNPLLV